MNTIQYIQDHWADIAKIYASIVTIASLLIKVIPPLPPGHWALPIVKFLAKFVALNTSAPTLKQRLTGVWTQTPPQN